MAASAARHGQNRFADDLKNLIDAAKAERIPRVTPTPVIQPHGELADLVTAEYPDVRLSDMTLMRVHARRNSTRFCTSSDSATYSNHTVSRRSTGCCSPGRRAPASR